MTTTEKKPATPRKRKGPASLESLRQRIDAIDDQIHDLIMERTRIVESVRDLKQGDRIKIRPAREDQIVCRLVARHRGHFPKAELVRMWREMIVATLGFEGPFSVAVYMAGDSSAAWDLARDYYGSYTPMTAHTSFHRVIEAVRTQESTVGVLPLPRQDDTNPWWRHLATPSADAPRIIARLPFSGMGNARGGDRMEALVICPIDRQPTGRDRSFLVFETKEEVRGGRFGEALTGAGFEPTFLDTWHDVHIPGVFLTLVEVKGYVAGDDQRLVRCCAFLGKPVSRTLLLGGYAEPLTAEELAPVPEGA
ncbi:MAG: chorismate mutase [Magnetospirillum sp. WYHS-4]